MPVPWFPWSSVALAVVALVCSVIRTRERARRASPQNVVLEIALSPLAALRLHRVALGVLLWTPLTFLIDVPVAFLVGTGAAGTVAVVCAGIALGAAGMPQIALGAALCQALWLPGSYVTTVLALPIVAGYLLRLLHIGPQYWRGYTSLLLLFDRQGPVIRAGLPAEWFWGGLQAGAALAPVAAAALLPAPDAGAADTAARWAGALLTAAQLALGAQRMRTLANRRLRLAARGGDVLGTVSLFAIAASPAGPWIAERWAGLPFLTGFAGGALLAVAAIGLLAALELAKGQDATSGLPRWAVPLKLARALLHAGLAAVLLSLLHPLPGLAPAAAVLAAAEFATLLGGRDRRFWDHQQIRHAASFLWFDNDRETLLGGWLHDAFLSRPHHPDFSLPRTMGGLAALSAQGWMVPGQAPLVGAPELKRPLTGIAATRWTDVAAYALDLVETQVVPRFPPAHLPALERGLAVARAELFTARAVVLHLAGEPAEALGQWREAALRYRRLGAPVHELVARLFMVRLLAVSLARPADARREYARIRLPDEPPPVVRHLARLAATAVEGGPDVAGESRVDAKAVRAALRRDDRMPAADLRQCMGLAALVDRVEARPREPGTPPVTAGAPLQPSGAPRQSDLPRQSDPPQPSQSQERR
ncbi:hypothetical protein AB0K40_09865 [Nonomuraea bangladeshensis]|uniref:Uncharacterized protein n=1 Tax=Nonomuraea bangladeshensis TaxID=404385 RepID=A0ABV3GZW9_9ACTN